MKQLEQIILSSGVVSVQEMNDAIFSAPQSSLLEALGQVIDSGREQKLMAQVAAELGVLLVHGTEVEVPPELPPADFITLVSQHKALPIAFEGGARPQLTLAMANPLDQAAKDAFAAVFKAEVVPALAREREIFKAFSRYGSRRDGRSTPAAQPAQDAADGLAGFRNSDPDVLRALQQVVATAVKHTASSVEIALGAPFTRAVFKLKEGLQTTVEISVHPQQLAATVIERTQLVEQEPRMFRGIARIEFKTLSINCVVSYQIADEKPAAGGVLRLTDFLFDVSENPHFWAGLSDTNAKDMRGLLTDSPGVVLIVSPAAEDRELLLRTIAESCPDLQIEDRVADLPYRLDLFDRALGSRLIVGVDGEDLFPVLLTLDRLPPARRQLIAGMIAFRSVARSCPVCSETKPIPPAAIRQIDEVYRPLVSRIPASSGCEICAQQKTLGAAGVVSILNFSSAAGEQFQSGARSTDILKLLAQDGYRTLFESALMLVDQGVVDLDRVMGAISLPPPEFTEAKGGQAAEHRTKGPRPGARSVFEDGRIDGVSFELDKGESKPAGWSAPVEKNEQPLRGNLAFVPRRNMTDAAPDNIPEQMPYGNAQAGGGKPADAPSSQLLLVIDDDADQRAVLKKVLEIAGYRVETAADGVDGILTATRQHPQLIIVDFMMPKIDGKETIRRLRSSPSTARIPIIALTAFSNPEVEFGLLSAGADDFCPKSISKKVLLKRIEKLTNQG